MHKHGFWKTRVPSGEILVGAMFVDHRVVGRPFFQTLDAVRLLFSGVGGRPSPPDGRGDAVFLLSS